MKNAYIRKAEISPATQLFLLAKTLCQVDPKAAREMREKNVQLSRLCTNLDISTRPLRGEHDDVIG